MKPRLLDLFCGAGGAAMGYYRAGFEVFGVDVEPQPNYPFRFMRADSMEFLEFPGRFVWPPGGAFDAIHASPPCQAYSIANNIHGRDDHPRLIEPLMPLLRATGLPWVVENVPGAPIAEESIVLCGRTFGLEVKRHRLFATSFPVMTFPCPHGHPGEWVSVFGHTVLSRGKVIGKAKGGGNRIQREHLGTDRGREAMGIDWMTRDELSEAIPPAYTEHIGGYLLSHLQAVQKEAA